MSPSLPEEPCLHVSVQHDDDATVIALFGELDLSVVALARGALAQATAHADEPVIIDLSGLEFLDSSGIHFLLEARAQLGDRLAVLRGPAAVQRVFEVSATAELLPFVD